jgi:hypothetical protein
MTHAFLGSGPRRNVDDEESPEMMKGDVEETQR